MKWKPSFHSTYLESISKYRHESILNRYAYFTLRLGEHALTASRISRVFLVSFSYNDFKKFRLNFIWILIDIYRYRQFDLIQRYVSIRVESLHITSLAELTKGDFRWLLVTILYTPINDFSKLWQMPLLETTDSFSALAFNLPNIYSGRPHAYNIRTLFASFEGWAKGHAAMPSLWHSIFFTRVSAYTCVISLNHTCLPSYTIRLISFTDVSRRITVKHTNARGI